MPKSPAPTLEQLLACPICHGALTDGKSDGKSSGKSRAAKGEEEALECLACALIYPVRDGIVCLLPDEGQAKAKSPDKGQAKAKSPDEGQAKGKAGTKSTKSPAAGKSRSPGR